MLEHCPDVGRVAILCALACVRCTCVPLSFETHSLGDCDFNMLTSDTVTRSHKCTTKALTSKFSTVQPVQLHILLARGNAALMALKVAPLQGRWPWVWRPAKGA